MRLSTKPVLSITNNKSQEVSNKFLASVRTRETIDVKSCYDKQPSLRSTYRPVQMDYSRYLGKPFQLGVFSWADTDAQWSNVVDITLPSRVYLNEFLKVPFFHSSLFRCKARIMVQVSGTPMHQGTLLVVAQPPDATTLGNSGSKLYVNSMLNAPHCFLAASNSTSVELNVPFYANSKLMQTDTNIDQVPQYSAPCSNQFASINVCVFNKLVAPTSGTKIVSVIVNVIFDELEFYAPTSVLTWVTPLSVTTKKFEAQCEEEECGSCLPKPKDVACNCVCGENNVVQITTTQPQFEAQSAEQSSWNRFTGIISTMFDNLAIGAKKVTGDFIDVGRGAVREYTGLHNGSITHISKRNYTQHRAELNAVDVPVPYNKLDPYMGYDRVTRDYTFDTDVDEMDIQHIITKPQYISTFTVSENDDTGKLKFSRPITPVQEVYMSPGGATPLMTANLQVLSYFTRFWRGSIKIHIQANMTNFHYCKLAVFKTYSPNIKQLAKVPSYDSVLGLMIDYLEFSEGGQVHTVELPYNALLNNLECARDWGMNAMQHGMYYIYVAQPLISNGTVAKSVDFNIFYSAGDDFQFSGYSTDFARIEDATTISSLALKEEEFSNIKAESEKKIAAARGKVEKTERERDVFFEKLPKEMSTVEKTNSDEVLKAKNAAIAAAMKELAAAIKNRDKMLFQAQGDEADVNSDGAVPMRKLDAENMRPISNMRDLVRRLVPIPPRVVTGAGISASSGVSMFSISSLLRMADATNTNPFSGVVVLRRFFLGMDGGVRVKFKIIGASNASVQFIPPGMILDTSTSDSPVVYASVPITTNDSVLSGLANVSYAYSSIKPKIAAPQQEASNYNMVQLGATSASTDLATNMQASECILDISIPNMNPFRFVGDASSYAANASGVNTPTVDLGYLVVRFKPIPLVGPLLNSFQQVIIAPYIGLGDEARLGFQVKSPTLSYPIVVGTSATYLDTCYQGQYGTDVAPLADPRVAAKASYVG